MSRPDRHLRWLSLILLGITAVVGQRADAQPLHRGTLKQRVDAFLAAVDRVPAEQLVGFFPRSGDFTYRHTVHSADGVAQNEWRFPAAEIRAGLAGPLDVVLTVLHERQPVGLFAHQLQFRGRQWIHLGDGRFVPPDADRLSNIYLRWRLEDGVWVISELADESFKIDDLPPWCC